MCTIEKHGNLFFLTLTGANFFDDHKINPNMIESLNTALAEAKSQATRGSALITTAEGNLWFSSGFDLIWAQIKQEGTPSSLAQANERLFILMDQFKSVVVNLISLPMPTIAVVSGKAYSAGWILAMSHDYVMMSSDGGVLYMRSLGFGIAVPDYFAAMFRSKVRSPADQRKVLLTAESILAEEAVRMGIVDSMHDSKEKAVEAAVRMGDEFANRGWIGEGYAQIRKEFLRETFLLASVTEAMKAAEKKKEDACQRRLEEEEEDERTVYYVA